MKTYLKVIILLLCATASLSTIADAKDKKKTKSVRITTGDIKEDYKVIDIVSASIIHDNLDDLKKELKKEARKLKADAVVEVRYLLFRSKIYAYGTAVKLKD